MPIRTRPLACLAALLAVATAGCASNRMAVTTPSGVQLSGNWALDPATSEGTGQVIAQLRAQIGKARHAQRRRQAQNGFGVVVKRRQGAPSGDSDEGSAGSERSRETSGPGALPDAVPPGSALIQQFVSNVPGDELTITVKPGSVTVVGANSSQQYTTGVQTAIDWGQISAEQISGWQGKRYVIDTRPQWGPAMTQSYGLAPDGALVMTLRLHGSGIDATLTRRYRRTRRAPAAVLPTSD